MIEVKYVPERNAIKVELDFHCENQYLAEVSALLDGLTKTTKDKELFVMALSARLEEIEKELENDKNNLSNKSDQ